MKDSNHSSAKLMLLVPAYMLFAMIPVLAQGSFPDFIKQVQRISQCSYEQIDSVTFKGHSKTYLYLGSGVFGIKMIPLMEEDYFDANL